MKKRKRRDQIQRREGKSGGERGEGEEKERGTLQMFCSRILLLFLTFMLLVVICSNMTEDKVKLIEKATKLRTVQIATCTGPDKVRFPDVHVTNGKNELADRMAAWRCVTTNAPVKYDTKDVDVALYV